MNDNQVDIQVGRDPNGGWWILVNAGGISELRAYRVPELYWDGLALVEQGERGIKTNAFCISNPREPDK